MIKVLMCGYNGQMGKVIDQIVAGEEGMEIAAGVDLVTNPGVSFPTFTSIKDCNVK